MMVLNEKPQDVICKLFCNKQGFRSIALLQPFMSLIVSDHFQQNGTKFDHILASI